MNYILKIIIVSVLFIIIDTPWLLYNKGWFMPMLGNAVETRIWPALIVYPVMAYLLLEATTVAKAATYGAAAYAIYDFTNMATLKNYQLSFAVADTIWGGILFASVKYLTQYIF